MTNSAETITAPELVKKLDLNRNTFDAWLKRGKLEDAILLRPGEDGSKSYVFDFQKAMTLIEEIQNLRVSSTKKNQQLEKKEKSNAPTITQSRGIKEAYSAQLAKLDFEERTQKLVNAKEVKRKFFNAARVVRNNLLAIPGRVASEIAGMDDPKQIEILLTDEIINTLEELQNVSISES